MPRTQRALDKLIAFLILLASAPAGSLAAQQAAHADLDLSTAKNVNSVAIASVTSVNVNANSLASRSVPSSRGSSGGQSNSSLPSKLSTSMGRSNHAGGASQISSQTKIDSGSIQAKGFIADVASSQRSTAQLAASYRGHGRATLKLQSKLQAIAGMQPPPISAHRSSMLNELETSSNSSDVSRHATYNRHSIGSGQGFTGRSGAEPSSGSGRLQTQGDRHRVLMHGQKLRRPMSGIRHSSHNGGGSSLH